MVRPDGGGVGIPQPPDWHAHAACTGENVNLFVPERNSKVRLAEPGEPASEARALRVCARCPVRSACLMDVLDYERESIDPITGHRGRNHPQGVFGGTTALMRRDRRLSGLSVEERAEVLEAWFKLRVAPTILAPTEMLA